MLYERLIWDATPASIKFHIGLLKPAMRAIIRFNSVAGESRSALQSATSEAERAAEDASAQVATLLTMCHADMDACHGALQLGRYFVELRSGPWSSYSSQAPTAEWREVFTKLADSSNLFNGRIAQQKKIRALLRTIQSPSPASLAAWKEAYRRWAALTQVVARPLAADTSDTAQEKAAYWHNLSGFLSALGGACAVEDTEKLSLSLRETFVNPKLINLDPPIPMIESFMQEMVDLLVSDSIWVREKVKETLGHELSPRLNGILLRQIHAVLSDFFDKSTGLPRPAEMFTVFVEQSISVVQMVMGEMKASQEATLGVDIGSLMVLYVEYVNSLGRTDQALRIKISMCQLCDSLMAKKTSFLFSNELRVRNRLFQALVTWTTDSVSAASMIFIDHRSALTVDVCSLWQADDSQGNERAERLQKELDMVCLGTIASLLDRLPLILADDALLLDDKVEWAKSRQFSMYFNYFLKVLNRTRGAGQRHRAALSSGPSDRSKEQDRDLATIRDSAIKALSNLLASNIDSGLQHSLPLAYKDDPRIRSAFMQIMTNVLVQGAQFGEQQGMGPSKKRNRIVELLCEGDMQLALCVAQICRGFDAEALDHVLLSIFDSKGDLMRFLTAAMEEEIERTPTEELVFRSNSFRTHLLSVYAKVHGYEYLRTILGPPLAELSRLKGTSYEIDPQKLEPGESAIVNQARLEDLAQTFIDAICTSAHRVPQVLRELCRHIRVLMDSKFPNSRYQGVGGLMFLRFISPAVVAPQLIDLSEGMTTKEARRGLLLVSKILQTLASNNLFPAHKEPFMTHLNDFLKRNVWRITNFLDQVSDARSETDRSSLGQHSIFSLGYNISEADQRALHRFLYDNVDKIGKDLLSRSAGARAAGQTSAAEETKRIYEDLCVALAELGDYAPDTSILQAFRHSGVGDTRQVLEEFLRRNAGKHVDSDAFSTLLRVGPPSKAGRPVIYYSCASIRGAVVDFEALIVHGTHLLQGLATREFDFVVDCTGMTAENFVPPQWVLFFRSMVAPEFSSNLRDVIIFNANQAFKESVRPYFAHDSDRGPGNDPVTQALSVFSIKFCSSLAELETYIARRDISLNSTAMLVASENHEHVFTSVTMVSNYHLLVPVAFKLGSQHLQIVALKPQEIFSRWAACTNEVIHYSDIEDVRPLPHRGEEHAFLVTTRGGRNSLLFHSRHRSEIVQALRQSKARAGRTMAGKTQRTLTPNDVPGTLLNMALLNMTVADYQLRASAYDLLCALSTSFNFGSSNARRRLLSVPGLAIPTNTTAFVAELSKDFAVAAPGVSLEFLISFFDGFEAAPSSQRAACLQYMAPWLSNLAIFTHTAREQQAEYQKRIKEILAHLIKITVQQGEMYATVQRTVWVHLGKLDDLLPICLEVFIEAAIDSGLQSSAFDAILDTMVSFSSINLRGKLLARLRKVS